MPGRIFLTRPVAEIAGILGIPAPENEDQPRRNIQPGQEIWAIAAGPTLRRMRWGMLPVGRTNARGRPVMETIVNARSETVFDKSAFADVGRCVVPADGWYEWTGKARRKTAWSIRAKNGAPLWFAAISDLWRAPDGREMWQVATVTCPPNADVEAIHDRMGVLLDPADIGRWLDGEEAVARSLLNTLPEGRLMIEEAIGVDWSGA
ncbi:SOS response-associated peptidase [Ovoidimarina sediminis]|uniref:SOS response-associated peptidase n=1 Tax=Ovoidimarina sediminis TaxID=3079856 RepID=UPI002910BF0E|nr:SOS response-associated peptidase [Rhodophyticola sp. MJ-SS7]MDU8942984.1 SOS response-associated peptidase [Rhodophyticola sp. MJ-SS7]